MPASSSISDLIAAWSQRLRDAFTAAIQAIRDAAQIGLIVRMLEKGDADGALRAVNLDPLQFADFEKVIGEAFDAGGRSTISELPGLAQPSGHRLKVLFDVRNPAAETWLRQHSSQAVTEIVADQRQAIQQHLEAGLARGDNPRTTALDLVGRIDPKTKQRIGGVIGLTSGQEAWARAYAAEVAASDPNALTRALRDKRFDAAVQRAIKSGQPIPAETQAKMVAAYRNRALRYRAETIGRTESLTSLHAAQHEATRQAVAKGQVAAGSVRRVWKSAHDSRVRDTHRHLDGQSVGMGEAFISSSGARLRFPGDPQAPAAETIQCRCTLFVRVDHLANVA